MGTTRRDALAAALGDSLDPVIGTDAGSSEANGSQAEAGFPFELLRGSRPGVDEPEPVKTRVKAPSSEKTERKPRGTASERQLSEIGDSIEEKFAQFAMLANGLAPVTSVYAAENSPKAVAALLSIAKRRPKVLAALTKVADGVDALELAKFVGGLVVAIQVDAQRLRGDEMVAQALGVTQILETHFWEEQSEQIVNPAMTFQAPRYAPV